MQPIDNLGASNRLSIYNRLVPNDLTLPLHVQNLRRRASAATITRSRSESVQPYLRAPRPPMHQDLPPSGAITPVQPPSPSARKIAYAPSPVREDVSATPRPGHIVPPSLDPGLVHPVATPGQIHANAVASGMTPLIDSVASAVRDTAAGQEALNLPPIELPAALTADDFTRAVAVATVSALRHQQDHIPHRPMSRAGGVHGVPHEMAAAHGGDGGHGGHDAPSWSRGVSASVLLGCTVLYALIAGQSSAPHFLD